MKKPPAFTPPPPGTFFSEKGFEEELERQAQAHQEATRTTPKPQPRKRPLKTA